MTYEAQKQLGMTQARNRRRGKPKGMARTLDAKRVTTAVRNSRNPKFMKKYVLPARNRMRNP